MTRGARRRFDVLIVGAGPAGIAAAVTAAECGVRVGIVDDNFHPGGQIWRAGVPGETIPEAVEWFKRLQDAQIEMLCGMRIFDHLQPGVLLAEGPQENCELLYGKLIIATGARERFLPFSGWTLPNVMGAGGLQAMVKNGLPIRGKRVVVAGTGPLLIAVAAYLRKHGAEIPIICEQASWRRLARFAVALSTHPGKIVQSFRLKKELANIRFATSSWPLAAHGDERLENVTISRNGKSATIACDYLACGFHLVPNTELASLLGCRIKGGHVWVDDFQQTSVPGVFCAGEPTGIGGVELALVEGQIAGFASAGNSADVGKLFAQREKGIRFVVALEEAFRLRPELRTLASAETLVCRCEDVCYSRLRAYITWRAAKLQTRCGMGPCQGRVCGPVTQFLFDWNPDSVRPPLFPARVESLSAYATRPKPAAEEITGGN